MEMRPKEILQRVKFTLFSVTMNNHSAPKNITAYSTPPRALIGQKPIENMYRVSIEF